MNQEKSQVAIKPSHEVQKVQEGFGTVSQERSAELAAIATAAAAKAEVEASYVMALKKPRMEEDSRQRILALCKDPGFAQTAIYSKPVSGKEIKGPSIRFAEQAIRLWQNVKSIQTVVYDDPQKKIIRQTMIDLESNVSFSEDITIEKTVERTKPDATRRVLSQRRNTMGNTVYLVEATDDEVQNKKNAHASKVIRNNGLRLIPEYIIAEAMDICHEAVTSKIAKDPEAEKRRCFDAFNDIGVMPSELEKYLGHPLSSISPKELAGLRAIYTAIDQGAATWAEYLKPPVKDADSTGMITMRQKQGTVTTVQEIPPQEAQEDAPAPKTPPAASQAPNPAPLKTLLDINIEITLRRLTESVGKAAADKILEEILCVMGIESLARIQTEYEKKSILAQLGEKLAKAPAPAKKKA